MEDRIEELSVSPSSYSSGRNLFDSALDWIQTSSDAPTDVRQLDLTLRRGVDGILDMAEFLGWRSVSTNCFRLGMEAVEWVAKKSADSTTKVTDDWENVVWFIISLVKEWRDNSVFQTKHGQSHRLKTWVLSVFGDKDLCPNVCLRLEMLHFMDMWNVEMGNPCYSDLAVSGLVKISEHLKAVNFLFSDLLWPLISLVDRLKVHGCLSPVITAARHQVEVLWPEMEAKCFSRLVQFLAELAEVALSKWEAGQWQPSVVLRFFEGIIVLLSLLLTEAP